MATTPDTTAATSSSNNNDDDGFNDGLAHKKQRTIAHNDGTASLPPLSPESTKPYQTSTCAFQGGRRSMEDAFVASSDGTFCAVLDGHGGSDVARYASRNLERRVRERLERTDETRKEIRSVDAYRSAVREALSILDEDVRKREGWNGQGSAAVVAWIHEGPPPAAAAPPPTGPTPGRSDEADVVAGGSRPRRAIVVANVGDCRAVICRDGAALDLSADHRADDAEERDRIAAMGGTVEWSGVASDEPSEGPGGVGTYRVNGVLEVSRSIGDANHKPWVSSEPEITCTPVMERQDDFVLLASDGLWDVMTSEEAVLFAISQLLDHRKKHSEVATLLATEAIRLGTVDNVTVVIIWLCRT